MATIRKVEAVVREHAEGEGLSLRRGHARDRARLPGGPKLVHLTFNVSEGPQVKIQKIDFVGNTAISDGTLAQADQGEQAGRHPARSSPAAAPTTTTSSTRTPSGSPSTTATNGYVRADVGEPEARVAQRQQGQEERAGSSCGFRSSKGSATGRRADLRRQHRPQERRRCGRSSRSSPATTTATRRFAKAS